VSAAFVTIVRQALAKIDVPLPDPVADALDRPVPHLAAPDRQALTTATYTAAADGRDPGDDPEVRRLLTLQQLDAIGVGRDLHTAATAAQADAIIDHAPAILDALAGVVDQADQVLADARPRLPRGVDLADRAGGVTLRGPDALAAWGAARAQVDRLDHVVTVWGQLAAATDGVQVPPSNPSSPLVLAALDLDAFDALTVRGHLAAVLAGHPANLASPDEFRRRVAAIDTERRRRQLTADAEGRRRAAGSSGRSLVPQ
jgi:hypothetical protein